MPSFFYKFRYRKVDVIQQNAHQRSQEPQRGRIVIQLLGKILIKVRQYVFRKLVFLSVFIWPAINTSNSDYYLVTKANKIGQREIEQKNQIAFNVCYNNFCGPEPNHICILGVLKLIFLYTLTNGTSNTLAEILKKKRY